MVVEVYTTEPVPEILKWLLQTDEANAVECQYLAVDAGNILQEDIDLRRYMHSTTYHGRNLIDRNLTMRCHCSQWVAVISISQNVHSS